MLSRTADHLFWMSRYLERAENLARLLDVTWQYTLVPISDEAQRQQWNAVLVLNSLEGPFTAKYDEVNGDSVLRFMVRDEGNPSSIYACLRMARENAHTVRGTITNEMWETINTAWLELREQNYEQLVVNGPGEFFEWVKARVSLLRGVTSGTMLRDEAFDFIGLGALLERADNTARLLDVKYYALKSSDDGTSDFYAWGALLRAVSAFEAYRRTFRSSIQPERVAELLILNGNMPRSLAFCLEGLVKTLRRVANDQSTETLRQAGRLYATLRYGRIEDFLQEGLHEFLTDFMKHIYALGDRISRNFLVV